MASASPKKIVPAPKVEYIVTDRPEDVLFEQLDDLLYHAQFCVVAYCRRCKDLKAIRIMLLRMFEP